MRKLKVDAILTTLSGLNKMIIISCTRCLNVCLHYCFGLLAVSPRYKGKYLAIFAGICFFNISVPGIVVVCYIVCCDYF